MSAPEIKLVGEDGIEDLLERHLNGVGVFEKRKLKEGAVGVRAEGPARGFGTPDLVEVAIDVVAESRRTTADAVGLDVLAARRAMSGRDYAMASGDRTWGRGASL